MVAPGEHDPAIGSEARVEQAGPGPRIRLLPGGDVGLGGDLGGLRHWSSLWVQPVLVDCG